MIQLGVNGAHESNGVWQAGKEKLEPGRVILATVSDIRSNKEASELGDMESPELPLAPPLCDRLKLRRELTLIDALSIVMGIIVGSGIFTTPGMALAQAGSVGEGLVVWIVAGAVAVCSALLYAELGTSIPVASGDAEFHKTAFGPSWSFAFIWTSFMVLFPGSINIIATSLAQYFLAAIASADSAAQDMVGDNRVKYVAITSVVVLTICNCGGVRFGSFLQNLLSLSKAFLVLVLLVVAGLFLSRDTTVLHSNFSKLFVGSSFSGFGPSMVAALWAFSGLSNIVFLTEELKNPSRDVPRASLGGIIIVTSIYLVVNVSYLSVLPASDIKTSVVVAMDATKAVLGQQAGTFTAILVAISMLGSVNATILCGGRYLFSAARDGHFYGGWLGQLNQRNSAPITALIAQLLNYFSIASYFFSALTAIAHWKLRYQFPDLPRPFRVPLHPCLNFVVISSSLYMIVTSVFADPTPTIFSLTFVLSSFPVYYIFVRKKYMKATLDIQNTPLLS